jgi:hypothetical protein
MATFIAPARDIKWHHHSSLRTVSFHRKAKLPLMGTGFAHLHNGFLGSMQHLEASCSTCYREQFWEC